MIKTFWQSNNIWELTNPLWYLTNIIVTVLFILMWILRPLFRHLRDLHWYYYKLPKKDIEFCKTWTRNFEIYTKKGKDISKYNRRNKLLTKTYNYCKDKVNKHEVANCDTKT